MTDSIFELLERRIMIKDGVNYLDGIDEPIGKETVQYIITQSDKLRDSEKVAESFLGMVREKQEEITRLKAQNLELRNKLLGVYNSAIDSANPKGTLEWLRDWIPSYLYDLKEGLK